jgi:hypothetical protein
MHFANIHTTLCAPAAAAARPYYYYITLAAILLAQLHAADAHTKWHFCDFVVLLPFFVPLCTVMSALGMRCARISRLVLSAGNLHINSWFRSSQIIDAV